MTVIKKYDVKKPKASKNAFINTNISEIFYSGKQKPNCKNAFSLSKPNKIHVYVSSQFEGSSFCGIDLRSKKDDEL